MPAHHSLSNSSTNISTRGASATAARPNSPSALGRTAILIERPMHRGDALSDDPPAHRRDRAEGQLGCHVFRATGITAYLEAGGTLENAQAMAAHEARVPPSSTTAPTTRSPSMRSGGSRFDLGRKAIRPARGRGLLRWRAVIRRCPARQRRCAASDRCRGIVLLHRCICRLVAE
jgi:hypothetical protein